MLYKILAKEGSARLLVSDKEGVGRVLDLDEKILYSPHSIASIAARGYWEEYMLVPKEVTPAMLEGVEVREEVQE